MAFGQEDEHEGADEIEYQTVSAFGEAFNNVAIHGYAGLPPGDIEISISWTSDELVIHMTDTGRSFDPAAVELPDLDALPEGKMGLLIMRSCMDQIDYQQGPPNVLRMIKHRPRASGEVPTTPVATTIRVASSLDAAESALRPAAGSSDWRLRAVKDAPSISTTSTSSSSSTSSRSKSGPGKGGSRR